MFCVTAMTGAGRMPAARRSRTAPCWPRVSTSSPSSRIAGTSRGPIHAGAALAKPAQSPRDRAKPHQPREGTKQAAVLALLRHPEGATVAQLAEATGWAAHTVRGFFAGLKKKGIEVGVLERVRQVGPNKDGAKGSFTVYRVAG
jgi:Protein of unknown function (DUF3489)